MTRQPIPQLVCHALARRPLGLAALAASVVVGLVTLLPAGTPDAPPAKDPPKKDAEPKSEVVERTADGFPLPSGAIFRFGNRQLRHADGISGSAISPDGKYLATLGGSVVVWDLKTLNAKLVLTGTNFGSYGYGDQNAALSFLPDSKTLLVTVRPTDRTSINVNSTVELAQLWDVETGKMKFGLKGGWSWSSSAWAVDGGKAIALHSGFREQATIQYFNAADGKELRSVKTTLTHRGLWVAADANPIGVPLETDDGISVVDGKTGDELRRDQGLRLLTTT